MYSKTPTTGKTFPTVFDLVSKSQSIETLSRDYCILQVSNSSVRCLSRSMSMLSCIQVVSTVASMTTTTYLMQTLILMAHLEVHSRTDLSLILKGSFYLQDQMVRWHLTVHHPGQIIQTTSTHKSMVVCMTFKSTMNRFLTTDFSMPTEHQLLL